MFSKPFRVKSNSHLKGSERKKFRAELLKNFPSLKDDDLVELIPSKEVIISMKIVSHSGENALIYSVQKLPVVFEIDSVMFPTVYMLWKFPNLLYTFTTWPQVLPKITGGADLMLPGVVLKDGFHIKAFGKLEKGDRVSVNLTNNSAPIAVGRAALSSMDMYMSAKRGKAVNILHFVGDELWGCGTKLPTPDFGPPDGFSSTCSDDDEEKDGTIQAPNENNEEDNVPSLTDLHVSESDINPAITSEDNNLDDEDEFCSGQDSTASNKDEPDICVASASCELGDREIMASASSELGDREIMASASSELGEQEIMASASSELGDREIMDELVEYCFLKALSTTAKKGEYPMLASKFYKLHMLPACPTDKSLDIKRSNYKKLTVFLNKMSLHGVVVVKELTKGVESIMSINPNHELLKNYVVNYGDDAGSSSSQATPFLDATCRPEITEMYVVTAAVLPVFSRFELRRGASLTAAAARKHITEYVKMENLQEPDKRRIVKLNATLSSVLGSKDAEFVQWEELFTKILSRMTRSYQMSFSGQSAVLNKGKLEPIDIQVGKRTGNKKVTLINNLELYGINLTEFARECQHGVAASTSISTVPGKKSAQLMVQGNQVLFIGSLLTGKYQIPKRYIRGLENAPKPKK